MVRNEILIDFLEVLPESKISMLLALLLKLRSRLNPPGITNSLRLRPKMHFNFLSTTYNSIFVHVPLFGVTIIFTISPNLSH